MNKFKIGDRVVLISDYKWNGIVKKYTPKTKLCKEGYYYTVGKIDYWSPITELRLSMNCPEYLISK